MKGTISATGNMVINILGLFGDKGDSWVADDIIRE